MEQENRQESRPGPDVHDDLRVLQDTQAKIKAANISFDILMDPQLGGVNEQQAKLLKNANIPLSNLTLEDVGGGVKGAHIDVYVDAGAKQLGTFRSSVVVGLPNGAACPEGAIDITPNGQ